MTVSDPLGDVLTRIRNAQLRGKNKIVVPGSNLVRNVLSVLDEEGYIVAFSELTSDTGQINFEIELKYFEGQAVIQTLQRISKPGRRVYVNTSNMPTYANGLGIVIISTSKGVMPDHQAFKLKVGGEALCRVF